MPYTVVKKKVKGTWMAKVKNVLTGKFYSKYWMTLSDAYGQKSILDRAGR